SPSACWVSRAASDPRLGWVRTPPSLVVGQIGTRRGCGALGLRDQRVHGAVAPGRRRIAARLGRRVRAPAAGPEQQADPDPALRRLVGRCSTCRRRVFALAPVPKPTLNTTALWNRKSVSTLPSCGNGVWTVAPDRRAAGS